jgi:hypothetical protein
MSLDVGLSNSLRMIATINTAGAADLQIVLARIIQETERLRELCARTREVARMVAL